MESSRSTLSPALVQVITLPLLLSVVWLLLAVGPVSYLALQGERLLLTGVCASRVLNTSFGQRRLDGAGETRRAHHAEERLQLDLQALVGASQLRDMQLRPFQLLGVHGDFLLQGCTLKFQELRK